MKMNNKIIEYKICSATDSHGNLDNKYINSLIILGWQPFGGLCAYNSVAGNNDLYQVMVKYED